MNGMEESFISCQITPSIPIQNKFLYTLQSEGYDATFGAKITGNLKEAEDEAEASTANTSKLNMKSHKGLHMAKKSCHIPA